MSGNAVMIPGPYNAHGLPALRLKLVWSVVFSVPHEDSLLYVTHDHNSMSLQGCGTVVPFWYPVPAPTPPLFAEIGSFVLFGSSPHFFREDKLLL